MDTPVAVVYAALVALSTNPELATEEFATQLAIELATLMANDRRRFNKEWINALIPGVAAPSGVHPVETPHSLEQPAGEYPVGAQTLHEIIDPVRRLIERLFLVLEIAPPTVDAERLVNAVLFTALNGRAARWNSQTGDATADSIMLRCTTASSLPKGTRECACRPLPSPYGRFSVSECALQSLQLPTPVILPR